MRLGPIPFVTFVSPMEVPVVKGVDILSKVLDAKNEIQVVRHGYAGF
ncbi:hypothetical protein [Paenibacillus sp. VTT E-133280]|nr:hypothetical protein [Paenibacillus sp. VTT E-133280]